MAVPFACALAFFTVKFFIMPWICIKFGTVFWSLSDLVQIFFAVPKCGMREEKPFDGRIVKT